MMRTKFAARAVGSVVLFIFVFALTFLLGGPAGTGGAAPAPAPYLPAITPPISQIPPKGLAKNFELVAHLPLMDDFQWENTSLGIPRGSNGDITASDHCVYVGSFIGYQPALIVDVRDPTKPKVIGPIPDEVPGVGNGIEGIEASGGDLLVMDIRGSLGGLGFDPPPGLPARGIEIYDISDCEKPKLVARFDYQGEPTHLFSLWRDPENPARVLAIQSFSGVKREPAVDIRVVDLTGCPKTCTPRLVAKWGLAAQFSINPAQRLRVPDGDRSVNGQTHEAIMSTDGRRIYVAEYQQGFIMLDSTRLISTLRSGGKFTASPGPTDCNPEAAVSADAEGYCLTALNPDITARDRSNPPIASEWYHTPIKVPGRPYLAVLSEASGPSAVDPTNPSSGIIERCPGAFLRILYVGDQDYWVRSATDKGLMHGDLYPKTIGVYGTLEQRFENCTANGFKPGTSVREGWHSPHDALVLPDLIIATYYGDGVRAIDISNPFTPVEVGYFIGKPVDRIRWASYGLIGKPEMKPDGKALQQPSFGPPNILAFSYALSFNGFIIYADTVNGLYVLRYSGPHADEIPKQGICLSGNPGAIRPGYEPCPPYGQTNWGAGK